MNKARRKTHKTGTLRRLARESLVLSCTRRLSNRFVRFFESGFASPLLTSAKAVNRFARQRITGPIYNKLGVRKSFAMPARNNVASFIERSPVTQWICRARDTILTSSLRTAGVFLLTFGIYAAAAFVIKDYSSVRLGAATSPDDLTFAAIVALFGLLIAMFGDKSILATLGSSKLIGPLLYNCLGVNDSSFIRHSKTPTKTAVGYGFLYGSLFGGISFLLSPHHILLFLLALAIFATIVNIPEFGLLLAVILLPIVPVGVVSAISAVTLISYFVKCLRLKRNFRFGTADAVVLLMYLATFIACATSAGEVTQGERYLLCLTALYFPTKNMICSEKLLVQAFNALCLSAELGMVFYLLGDFATLIPHAQLRNAAVALSEYALEPEMLAVLVSCALPFALSSHSALGKRRAKKLFVPLALATALFFDSMSFYVLLVISALVYVAAAYKAPIGALLGGLIVLPPVIVIANGFSTSVSVVAGRKLALDKAFEEAFGESFATFWQSFVSVGGVVSSVLLAIAFLLILQRVLGSYVGENGSSLALFGGTVTASAINVIICGTAFNTLSDVRLIVVMWFVFGLCGSIYKVAYRPSAKEA